MDNIVVAEKQKENNIFDKIKNSKRLKIILIVLAIIICLSLTLTSFRDIETNQENIDVVNTYVNNLQAKLEKTLSKVKGVGKVSVVITIDSGMETVLASKITINETQSGKETIETPEIKELVKEYAAAGYEDNMFSQKEEDKKESVNEEA